MLRNGRLLLNIHNHSMSGQVHSIIQFILAFLELLNNLHLSLFKAKKQFLSNIL